MGNKHERTDMATTPNGPAAARRRPLEWLLALATLALLLAPMACDRNDGAAGPPPTPTPEPPAMGAISGNVQLEGETDHSGTLVFIGGASYSAYTDIRGDFTIAGVPSGAYALTAQHEGFEKKHYDDTYMSFMRNGTLVFQLPPITLSPRQIDSSQVIERSLGSITGFIHYADRNSHDGIHVFLDRTPFSAVTDETGGFALLNVEPGSYVLNLTAEGYEPRSLPVNVTGGDVTTLLFAEGEALDYITLQPDRNRRPLTRTILGMVELYDPEGERLPRTEDTLVALEGTAHVAAPDESGRFAITGVPEGTYAIIALARGFMPMEDKIVLNLAGADIADVTLRLQEMVEPPTEGSARGRIVLADGAPPLGIQVGLAGVDLVAITDGQGEYAFRNVQEGVYALIASLAGYESLEIGGIVIEADRETIIPDVELVPQVVPPVVLTTTPAHNATNVPVLREVTVLVRFSEKMNPGSVLSSLSVSPEVDYQPFIGRTHPQSDYDMLCIVFQGAGDRGLRFNTAYQITIGTGARDDRGVAMEGPYRFSFRTGRAEIIRTDPEDGASAGLRGIAINPVRIFFNAPIRHDSLAANMIRISPSDGYGTQVEVYDDPSTGWSIAAIRRDWRRGERYRVTINGRVRLRVGTGVVSNTPYNFSFVMPEGQDVGETRASQRSLGRTGR